MPASHQAILFSSTRQRLPPAGNERVRMMPLLPIPVFKTMIHNRKHPITIIIIQIHESAFAG